MLVENDKQLDKLVRKEIKKIKLPKGWKAEFSPSKTPGRGDFHVYGIWNGAKFKYEREVEDESYITLKKDGHEIFINTDNEGIYSVHVNDFTYTNPENSFCEREKQDWKEKTHEEIECDLALDFGRRVVKNIQQHLTRVARPLVKLIDVYYSGGFIHPESRHKHRSNREVYDKFDLSP
jgi:hypothetical protein